jgi:hypothetical protein
MPKESKKATLSTAQIGRCGELLVQLQLLRLGIDSAPLSTDAGVDLVAYQPKRRRPITIQVKANLKPKPSGGKGRPALDWWVPVDSPAQYVALVNLALDQVWLMTQAELAKAAQQRSSGRYHFYMYTDAATKPNSRGRVVHAQDFTGFLLDRRAGRIFGA